jgi:hypothetical protein
MRPKKRQQFDMRAHLDAATGRVHAAIDALGADDSFQNGLEAKFDVTGPAPATTKTFVSMRQTAPGRYEADFPLERFGSYVLHGSLQRAVDEGGTTKMVTAAESFGSISHPYPREFLALAPDIATLAQVAALTGGTKDPEPAAVFDPAGEVLQHHEELWPRFVWAALAVYLLDLLLRRVRLLDRKQTIKPALAARAR